MSHMFIPYIAEGGILDAISDSVNLLGVDSRTIDTFSKGDLMEYNLFSLVEGVHMKDGDLYLTTPIKVNDVNRLISLAGRSMYVDDTKIILDGKEILSTTYKLNPVVLPWYKVDKFQFVEIVLGKNISLLCVSKYNELVYIGCKTDVRVNKIWGSPACLSMLRLQGLPFMFSYKVADDFIDYEG